MLKESVFEAVPINTSEIPQEHLDLANRVRTNPFPWRGQFSPGLVELLLKKYAREGSVILDPFAGIGTTLVEAARCNLASIGTEINPAAVAMAGSVVFVPLRVQQRQRIFDQLRDVLKQNCPADQPLWAESEQAGSPEPFVLSLLRGHEISEYERSLLQNTLIRLFEIDGPHTWDDLFRCYRQHCEVVAALPHSTHSCRIENSDARSVPMPDGSVDLVLTSPPYVNVFNYHQNNRPAMELLGWDLLEVAKSEFGSNRKNRGNRFLTVVQYCIDMFAALIEMKRVLTKSGRAIIVIGRESSVRGVAFKNGLIVGTLAEASGFRILMRQERKFKNKFGGIIFEDILHIERSETEGAHSSVAVEIAREALGIALQKTTEPDVQQDLKDAIQDSTGVPPSPLYRPPATSSRLVA
ncbi:MAG: site-specific DNA-methyltransferase [Acidobacteria bacterium]|nr:site-specific DNA-methyltransferase [Acidobacteriota bacterium]